MKKPITELKKGDGFVFGDADNPIAFYIYQGCHSAVHVATRIAEQQITTGQWKIVDLPTPQDQVFHCTREVQTARLQIVFS